MLTNPGVRRYTTVHPVLTAGYDKRDRRDKLPATGSTAQRSSIHKSAVDQKGTGRIVSPNPGTSQLHTARLVNWQKTGRSMIAMRAEPDPTTIDHRLKGGVFANSLPCTTAYFKLLRIPRKQKPKKPNEKKSRATIFQLVRVGLGRLEIGQCYVADRIISPPTLVFFSPPSPAFISGPRRLQQDNSPSGSWGQSRISIRQIGLETGPVNRPRCPAQRGHRQHTV